MFGRAQKGWKIFYVAKNNTKNDHYCKMQYPKF